MTNFLINFFVAVITMISACFKNINKLIFTTSLSTCCNGQDWKELLRALKLTEINWNTIQEEPVDGLKEREAISK